MPTPQQRFNFRDLAAAALYSCCVLLRAAVAIAELHTSGFMHNFFARVLLPAADDHVRVLRIKLHEARLSTVALTGDEGRSRASEEVRNDIAGLAAVQQSAFYQFDRLHSRMQPVRRRLLFLP